MQQGHRLLRLDQQRTGMSLKERLNLIIWSHGAHTRTQMLKAITARMRMRYR